MSFLGRRQARQNLMSIKRVFVCVKRSTVFSENIGKDDREFSTIPATNWSGRAPPESWMLKPTIRELNQGALVAIRGLLLAREFRGMGGSQQGSVAPGSMNECCLEFF